MGRGHEASSKRFVIAALGASAGGLEALENFFQHRPPDTGFGFIVVQHLPPDRKSALPDLLARHTPMPVERARDNAKVEPNHVYIIPPNATLTIVDGNDPRTTRLCDRRRKKMTRNIVERISI